MKLSGDLYFKSAFTFVTAAFSFEHALLMLLPNPNVKYQWVQTAMIASVALLATMGIVAIWLEFELDLYYRILTMSLLL